MKIQIWFVIKCVSPYIWFNWKKTNLKINTNIDILASGNLDNDYKNVNAVKKPYRYPLPHMHEFTTNEIDQIILNQVNLV